MKYFDLPVSRGRMEWLIRGVLALLTWDIWSKMMSRAGRYGFREFNISHWPWLDVIQPMPNHSLYIGSLLLASVAAIFGALAWRTPLVVAVACGGWTWAWACSLLDSFQHHYFLSLVLVCFFGFPMRSDAGRSWGFPLLTATTAIMYFFASFSKLAPEWRDGSALRRVARSRNDQVESLFASLGLESSQGWELVAAGAVTVQVTIGIAYLLAPLPRNRWLHAYSTLALLSALSFHMGAEWLNLKIGWFSYYMMVMAIIVFSPAIIWDTLWEKIAKPLSEFWQALTLKIPASVRTPVCLSGILIAAVSITYVDLPGSLGVALLTAMVVITVMMLYEKDAIHVAGAMALIGVLMWWTYGHNESRYNFYRFVGGDASRVVPLVADIETKRELLETAIMAYEKANQYAPEGKSREDQLQKVRAYYMRLPPPKSASKPSASAP